MEGDIITHCVIKGQKEFHKSHEYLVDGMSLYDIAVIHDDPTNQNGAAPNSCSPGAELAVCVGIVNSPRGAPVPSTKRREEHRVIGMSFES